MKKILGDAKNIQSLLANARFGIDYFQREYRWEKKHVEELIDDLSQAFHNNYDESDSREDVMNYDLYFLGSIITSERDGQKSIVDGQQRLTTITLLLVYLYHTVESVDLKTVIAPLIASHQFGRSAYNLDVPPRNDCMDFLFSGRALGPNATDNPSVANIIDRYQDIESVFPDEISQSESLPYFIDWLLQKVYFVDTTADTEADAYTIFETMNDRGLSLTPAEMMRGYLLANINDQSRQRSAMTTWDDRIRGLEELGHGEGADALRAWLRSQYAKRIRQGGRRSVPEDFDVIGTEFHRWVRDRKTDIGLRNSAAFADFIEREMDFYAQWYGVVRRASKRLTDGLEPFFYVGQTNFTLQYMAALAPLVSTDDNTTAMRKLRTVATFIDCVIYRRIWNGRSIAQATMRVPMFRDVALKVRHLDESELAETLSSLLDNYGEQFVQNGFSLHGMNGPKIHQMLARMTDYVDSRSGRPSLYRDYLRRWGRGHYQIEHVLSESHRDGFDDFDYHRNKVGALVLLPGRVNASIGDMPYREKREQYPDHNLLAGSLHDRAYHNKPEFNAFMRDAQLDFKPYEEFDVDAINERQELYRQLAMRIWSTDSIREAAGIT